MEDDWRRPGKLPWGWWLRSNRGVLEDEHGRTWSSVRDGFWQGELGFPAIHFAPEQHELLLRTMTAIESHWFNGTESKHDVFGGDMMFWRFYQCWLGSIGMLSRVGTVFDRISPLEARLSPQGRSVLMMLQATRDPAWEDLPMAEVIEAVVASGRGPADEARETALKAFERSVGIRRHVFARERIGRSHVVTLTGMHAGGGARMPVMRVTWSVSCADRTVRDDLFAWLAARVHRWDDWGEMAFSKGGEAFTGHLLMLIVASRAPGAES